MMTVRDHIDRLAHQLGGTPDARHSLYDTLNMAGRRLYSEHDWTWRNKRATLTSTEDQDHILLPEDCGGLIWCAANVDGALVQFELVTLRDLTEMRTRTVSDTFAGRLYGTMLGVEDATSEEEETRPAIWVWPTPGEDEVSLELVYLRRWVAQSANDTQRLPPIPAEFELALALGAAALGFKVQQPGTGKYEEAEAAYLAEVVRMKTEDGRRQPFMGRIRGGVGDFYAPGVDRSQPGVSNFGVLTF